MEINSLKFEISHYDLSYEKKVIVRKLTGRKYQKEYPEVTDYAVLNGLKTKINKKGEIYGDYWIANTQDVYEGPMDMIAYGPDYTFQKTNTYGAFPTDKTIGTKPSIKYSLIEERAKVIKKYIYPKCFYDEEYYIVEFGEYPQNLAMPNTQKTLNDLYSQNKLNKTGRSFSRDIGDVNEGMLCVTEDEYEYQGKKYVRVKNLNPEGVLSNGKKAGVEDYYWIKVEPVVWFVDKDEDIATTNKIIIGGVAYNNSETYSYQNTYISNFIEYFFKREINQKTIRLNTEYTQSNDENSNQKNTHKVKVKVKKIKN